MKEQFSLREWAKTEEGKKMLKEVLSKLPTAEQYSIIKNKIDQAKDTAIEMGPTIIKDFQVNPIPDLFYDFLMHQVGYRDSLDMSVDELLREYAMWRKANHYNHLKWHPLFDELINSGYIEGSFETFNFIMSNKHLPVDANKIQWRISQADAIYLLIEGFKFSYPEINRCFESRNGKPFQRGSKSETARDKELTAIRDKYCK